MESKLDMSMMLAMHDALRRDLKQVAPAARLREDHPGRLLHAALGFRSASRLIRCVTSTHVWSSAAEPRTVADGWLRTEALIPGRQGAP
jgi:regulator of extracellular matrix RemA (YlzA/DUF370 family)